MRTLGKVDCNKKVILLKSKGQRNPQAPKYSILYQIHDNNKEGISIKREKEKEFDYLAQWELMPHCEPHKEIAQLERLNWTT